MVINVELPTETLEQLKHHRQSHLVQFWDELSQTERVSLLKQINELDFDLLAKLIDQRDNAHSLEAGDTRAQRAKPPEQLIRLPQSAEDLQQRQQASELGEELLKAGKVGAILVAGGQGSRLGFDDPKGMFPIGPVTERTLFQILCEQLLARSRRANCAIPYFIMTSEATHAPTVEFFEQNHYFGLGTENVYFFQQASLPAIEDCSHRILLADKSRIATSPDGHGGILNALHRHGMLTVMRERGIEHLYYHQVDNPTAIVCDPELIGLHAERDSQLTTKVVAKTSPEEKMGVLVSLDKQTQIIEYSDLPEEEAYRKDESGHDVFWAGNTAIHVFQRAFLESLQGNLSLPFHIAHKPISYLDSNGTLCEADPGTPNGNKFEQFIFDALPHASSALVVEGDRAREFNPVKNAEGNDSPATARAALNRIAKEWIEAAGGKVLEEVNLEISPLFAINRQEFIAKCPANLEVNEDRCF